MTRPEMTSDEMRAAADDSMSRSRRMWADPSVSHQAKRQAAWEAAADEQQWKNSTTRR